MTKKLDCNALVAMSGLCLALLSVPALTQAQDAAENKPAAAAEEPATTASYADLRKQWDDLNRQMDSLGRLFQTAAAADRPAIREQYLPLVTKANALLPQLRAAGIEAYKAAPNEDAGLVKLLVGIAANEVRRDQYDAAAKLAGLLIENQCSEKAIYGLAGVAAYCLDDFETAGKFLQIAKDANVLTEDGQIYLTDLDLAKKLWKKEAEIRAAEKQADDLPRVLLKTSQGEITVELFENEAPQTVGNFVSLVEKKYYDGLSFHRVLPGFMAQGGCPKGDGSGDPGYSIRCECYEPNHRNHFRGVLSMAKGQARDSGGSQFFLTFRRTSHLDGLHTVFGRVTTGLDVLEKLQRIDPQSFGAKPTPDKILEAKVVRKRDHVYQPTKAE